MSQSPRSPDGTNLVMDDLSAQGLEASIKVFSLDVNLFAI